MKLTFFYIIYFLIFLILSPLLIFIAIILLIFQGKPIIFWSKRVGKDKKIFSMPKFRTMKNSTPMIATHLLGAPEESVTNIGKFLRKYSLDEIPQIVSLLQGHMTIVGPRPALYNQYDLISLREQKGLHSILPGITGLAQINGRDSISIEEKVNYDFQYLKEKSIVLDSKIIFLTIFKIFKSSDVSH